MTTTSAACTALPGLAPDAGSASAPRIIRWLTLMLVLLACAQRAQADTPDTVHRLFSRMQAAGLSFGSGVDASQVQMVPTLVRGLFLLRMTGTQESLGFVNEAATLVGGGKRGFATFDAPGKPARRLTSAEALALRQEVLAGIDYSRLVEIRYGSGGGRRILELSAVDCPSCRQFEQTLAGMVARQEPLATTFYLLPSALTPVEDGGEAAWQGAANIWCADNPGRAWQAHWTAGGSPAGNARPECHLDARSAQREAGMLRNILRGVGLNVDYTPTFVLEDGTLAPANGPRTAEFIQQHFGAAQTPAAPSSTVSHWLTSGAPP